MTDLAWKGRFIVTQDGHTVDLPPDRQEVVGSPDGSTPAGAAERVEFLDKLNEVMPSKMLFQIIRSKLRAGEIKTRERNEVVLLDATHDGERWLITGNANASAGYLYVEARTVGRIVCIATDPNGSNWADGIFDSTLVRQIEMAGCGNEVQDAVEAAHLDAWERHLIDAGFEPVRLEESEIDTEIAAGRLRAADLVSREQLHDGNGPVLRSWQKAWDEIDIAAIARDVLRERGL